MSAEQNPLAAVVGWLTAHANFPRSRLAPAGEALICFAALAEADAAATAGPAGRFQRKDPAQTAALRAHAMRRSQVHFKCDNSAKV